MKEILLTQSKVTSVDDEDGEFARLNFPEHLEFIKTIGEKRSRKQK